MLILSRKTNQRIIIDGNVVITIVEIRGDQVRVGIDAPKSTRVDREEVFNAKARLFAKRDYERDE
jgi:carbon storage regulator|tara:strand:- start:68 stop:262 length:195 start_codon:yes stop_codon:yes gene_type:complete